MNEQYDGIQYCCQGFYCFHFYETQPPSSLLPQCILCTNRHVYVLYCATGALTETHSRCINMLFIIFISFPLVLRPQNVHRLN